ncbi:MAG: SGNH/GDSL hydrolase family protein, partial [Ilumatobacteraceae bacterium]
IEVPVAPEDAAAVTGTFTIVEPLNQAFLIAEPCNAVTDTSVVNATARGILANTSTVAVSNGRLCITASQPTHTLFDVSGWWVERSIS